MALTYPYPLDFLAKCIIGQTIPLDLQRFDEMSGGGDGRMWTTELARPLWSVSYDLFTRTAVEGRGINAKVRALDGFAKPMLWADPYYPGPASGVTTGLDSVTVSGIRPDRGGIGLSGLPAGFVLTTGDRFTITYASGRVYMGEFSEGGTAGPLGNISEVREIRPYLPFGVSTGAAIELVRPYFKAGVTSFTPFASERRRRWGVGASISLIQKP